MDSVFDMLKEGLEEAISYEQGKKKLRVNTVSIPAAPKSYSPEKIKRLRGKLNCSQAVFANLMNVSLRTVQSWEIGERHPSQASLRLLQLYEGGAEVLGEILASLDTENRSRKKPQKEA